LVFPVKKSPLTLRGCPLPGLNTRTAVLEQTFVSARLVISRTRHQTILFAVTLPVVIVGFGLILRHEARTFFILCGGYVAFLAVFTLWCQRSLPKNQRTRPPKPAEFGHIRLGPISLLLANLMQTGEILKTKELSKRVHRLICIERPSENGKWICQIEDCSGEILAYSVVFQSNLTPALDCGESRGTGAFFSADS
jgi:hypothetical protein